MDTPAPVTTVSVHHVGHVTARAPDWDVLRGPSALWSSLRGVLNNAWLLFQTVKVVKDKKDVQGNHGDRQWTGGFERQADDPGDFTILILVLGSQASALATDPTPDGSPLPARSSKEPTWLPTAATTLGPCNLQKPQKVGSFRPALPLVPQGSRAGGRRAPAKSCTACSRLASDGTHHQVHPVRARGVHTCVPSSWTSCMSRKDLGEEQLWAVGSPHRSKRVHAGRPPRHTRKFLPFNLRRIGAFSGSDHVRHQ
ncbi:unnamed protein product [Rangifer tarandus platyrhynchus]|uniref:Uncharacterized protein n=1 Tax=Rangifer tarandus platyrhynchus TaxID=3082113 RepID=A0AC59ZY64_RANTA